MAVGGLQEVGYAVVLLWTVLVWAAMLVCPRHPTLHRLLRTPFLMLAPHFLLYLILVLPPLLKGEVSVWGKPASQHHLAMVAGLERVLVGFAAGLVGPAREVALAAMNLFAGWWLFTTLRQQNAHRALFTIIILATMLAGPLGLALHWAVLIVKATVNTTK